MNSIKQFLFVVIAVVGLSLAVSAQRGNDQKKPPPKPEDRPVVVPREKPPRGNERPENRDRDRDRDQDNRGRPQRPEMSYVIFVSSAASA